VVLAAAADPGGPNGTFQASSLKPAGSWSTSGASGDFTYSYPITVPPVASGSVAPQVGLSYDSSTVDGQTASTNDQSSWVGEGWDYSPGYVERTYRPCSNDTDLTNLPNNDGDECWAGQILTMSLQGQQFFLVQDDTTHTWHPSVDNGDRVELLTGANNGALNGEYWRITTTDGTQYYFGRNTGPGTSTQGATNSTWTMPVYGDHPGDPCYTSTTFTANVCNQAWRWNLDYVEDTHGNATMYYYTPETNYYDAAAKASSNGVVYTRGGYLDHIDYGLRDESGSVYGAPAPDRISFTTAERCLPSGAITCNPSQFTAANASSWPDTPQDQQCLGSTTCANNAPTFWSTKRLTTITTSYYTGGSTPYAPIDTYALNQQFSTSGDPALWLNSITRTGHQGATSITLPPITFAGQLMDNRVAGYNQQPPMAHWRLTNITTETGETIRVTYDTPDCSTDNMPTSPDQDAKLCFPVNWTLPYDSTEILDYFQHYVVTEIDVSDATATGFAPTEVTKYNYVGSPAWHYDDDEIVKPADRTYGQFRGYGEVDTLSGDPTTTNINNAHDTQTLTKTTYYRGMNGDTLPGGGTRSVTVSDSLGETVPDDDQYADTAHEVQTFNGVGGPRISSTITDLETVATTASRARTGLPALLATDVQTAKTRTITDLAAGGARTTTDTYAYDSFGRVTEDTDSGDGVPDVCTSTRYADNTTSWIREDVAEVITSQQTCPTAGTTPAPILADVRSYYDLSTTLGAIPGPGDNTRTDTATANNSGVLTFATTSHGTFDASGRPLTNVDALGNSTAVAYTPTDGGNLTETVSTNALNQQTTSYLDPARGVTTAAVDVANHRTDASYDALGRLTAVWLPGHSKAVNSPASATYAYQVSNTGPESVTTKTLVITGTSSTSNYTTSVAISDGMGLTLQTQADGEGGGRIVTSTFYDSHGWPIKALNAFPTSGTPSTTLVSVADSAVNSRTLTTYDGDDRATLASNYTGLTFTDSTQSVYSGDSTTTIPPQGGVPSTTFTDVRGNTTELRQYTSPPTISGSTVTAAAGTYQSTTYHTNVLGQQDKITDADNDNWTYSYDMLGRPVTAADPSTGTSHYSYDNDGNLTSSTDGRGQTLAYTYDALNRKTAEYSGSTSGTELASWVYDTVQAGQLSYSTRYTPQGNYLVGVGHYDGAGNPNSTVVRIASGETGFANQTYTTTYAYTATNLLDDTKFAPGGGLPGNDDMALNFDNLGNPTSETGYNRYVNSVAYTSLNEPSQYQFDQAQYSSAYTINRDPQTRRIIGTDFSAQQAVPEIDGTTYSYDRAGNVTSSTDTEGPVGSPVQQQCFGYDSLDRLNQAWTTAGSCSQAPTTSAITGANPYWLSWTFDPTGLRKTQTQHALPGATGGDTTTNYTYPTAGTAQSDSLTSTSTAGPAGASTTSYAYDAAGNTTTRNLPSGQQTLTWDAENHLAADSSSNGTSSYVYDADGNELLRHDPGSTTLFLPGEELVYDTVSKAITGTRYYTFNGQTIAVRNGARDPQYLSGDLNGTDQVVYNPDNGSATRRAFDPYGNPIGSTTNTSGGTTGPGLWPDDRGYLNAPQDTSTGLTDVGTREYDSSTGRFISVDPVLDPSNPASINGYTYGDDSPVTQSDPTGQWIGGGCVDRCDSTDPSNVPPPLPGHAPSRPSSPATISKSYRSHAQETSIQANGRSYVAVNDLILPSWVQYDDVVADGIDSAAQEYDIDFSNTGDLLGDTLRALVAWCEGQGTGNGNGACSRQLYDWAEKATDQYVGPVAMQLSAAGMLSDGGSAFAASGDSDAGAADAIAGDEAGPSYLNDPSDPSTESDDETYVGFDMCALNSFAGDTKVLMAGGGSEPISQVATGDVVENADPGAPPGAPDMEHAVAAVHVTYDDRSFTDITVPGTNGRAVIASTSAHLYWDETTRLWTPAASVKVGDKLQSLNGSSIIVLAVRSFTGAVTTYNLTISGVHDYFVIAGAGAALVHNCPASASSGKRSRAQHLQPNTDAGGAHTVFERDADGKVVRYQTWNPNSQAPSGWSMGPRFRGEGGDHSNVVPPIYYPTGGGRGISAPSDMRPPGY
jgi:RHS repeat-associated protein